MTDHQQHLSLLADQAGRGDERAFRALTERTTQTSYGIAYRILRNEAEAQDVLQEAYLRVWKQLPTLRNTKAVAGWIYQICRNVALDRKRYLGRRQHVDIDNVFSLHDEHTPESQVADAQQGELLALAIGRLKEKHRMVVLMRDVDGMSIEEIALALGIAEGTVDSRLHRARKHLVTLLGREEKREQTRVQGSQRRAEGEL